MRAMIRSLLVFIALINISPQVLAVEDPNVLIWAKQITLKTLSVNYTMKRGEMAREVSKNYSHNGWNAIVGFLGGYMTTVHNQKLTLHPAIIDDPSIVESGTLFGDNFWRVNESVTIPELQIVIGFSLLIHDGIKSRLSTPYVIQSLDIVLKK